MAIETYQLMSITFGGATMNLALDFELFHHFKDESISADSDIHAHANQWWIGSSDARFSVELAEDWLLVKSL
jgi:hypothetical protein